MVWRKACVALVLAVSGMAVGGCSSTAALPEHKTPATPAPSRQSERAAKSTARESAFSTYSNPEVGVAFHYPRNFALEEGAPDDRPGVRSQQELENQEPGTVLVATVIVPDDAYPNTTFAGGSLQFAVNDYLTAGSCGQNLVSRLGDSNRASGKAIIQGVAFTWTDSDQGDAGTEYFERDYAGFANDTCYEFFLRVGVDAAGDQDAGRAPDENKILGHLDKIVSSLQMEPKAVSVLDGPATARTNHGVF
jgi:hypothetical protein